MEYSQSFTNDIHYTIFAEHIVDPRSFVLFAYGNDGTGVAYSPLTRQYVPLHLTENVFNWSGKSEYKAEIKRKGDFLTCENYVIAHVSGVCTGFSIPYAEDIRGVIRTSAEVLVVVKDASYCLYHINGVSFREVDNIRIVNRLVFTKDGNRFICVDDMFTSVYDLELDKLGDYPYAVPKLVPAAIPETLRRFIDNHDFSEDG